MIFGTLIAFIALVIASCSAYFGIYGLAVTYSYTFWAAVVMFASLEAGKITLASFLYQYWYKINNLFRTILFCITVGLVIFSSIGIFAFLTSSYQMDSVNFERNQVVLENKVDEKDRVSDRLYEINSMIEELPDNYVTRRNELREEHSEEISSLRERLENLNNSIYDLREERLDLSSEVGPIMFIADNLNIAVDKAVFYLTIGLTIVFDPLAVLLILAANVAFSHSSNLRHFSNPVNKDTLIKGLKEYESLYGKISWSGKISSRYQLISALVSDVEPYKFLGYTNKASYIAAVNRIFEQKPREKDLKAFLLELGE